MTSSIEAAVPQSRNRAMCARPRYACQLIIAALGALAAPSFAAAQTVDPDAVLAHIRYLASDELKGREAGDEGADSAAAYIARQMEGFGLEPLGTEGYLQPFEITTTVAISPDSRLVLHTGSGDRPLALYDDWLPFSFSSAGRVNARAYDAGYGLDAESFPTDPKFNAPPKVAVIRGGTPEDVDPHTPGLDASPRFKATRAREHGAAAVLITVPRIQRPPIGQPPRPLGIPAAQVIESEKILGWLESDGLRVTLDTHVQPVRARAYNVVGRAPGSDPARRDEVIVVGAHYDHLGLGGPGSLAPDEDAVHNGADDNASGTAVMLELARYFAAHPDRRPGRSLVFVAFSAEEMGLLGSEQFVEHAPIPLENIVAMVNLDMVGRLRDGRLQIFGSGTAEEFPAILDSLEASSPLSLSHSGDGYGPSDQTSFYARRIPVLHLFTGAHSEYHRPEDDWQLIDADGTARVADFAIALIRTLGDHPDRLHVVERPRPTTRAGGGYGPYLGTIPDFGEVEGGGVRLTGVRAGGPAERAGLRGGDVVIEFGGSQILNLYDYTYALRAHAPGDTVVIKVRRGDREIEVEAVLERRQ